ncbi:peptide transporter, partial [Parabacteroides johnsonii]|nr:peptide transporter [Parabacteroides johnsonii]
MRENLFSLAGKFIFMRETKNGKQQAGSHLSLLLSKKRRSFAESQDIKLQISYIMEDEEKVSGLPENAYRELKEGEVYKP